ncbi:hypothetical protein [Streptomyces sp. NPDC050538]|uniref:hypothetical protein n=1 Tax=Streptomyces sp. NPDC050538 TaxID=3365627 RepID=UPI0037A19B80
MPFGQSWTKSVVQMPGEKCDRRVRAQRPSYSGPLGASSSQRAYWCVQLTTVRCCAARSGGRGEL